MVDQCRTLRREPPGSGWLAEGGGRTHVRGGTLETSVTLRERHSWFGRFEVGGKPAHDLDVDVHGGSLSLGFVPRALEAEYGSRANLGFGLFVTLRPAAHGM